MATAITRGIILAGGNATRMYPLTYALNKHLLPVYNKPMIYYPISLLMMAGIREILIISSPEGVPQFKGLLGDGKSLGIHITYKAQEKPSGLPDAFIVGEEFAKGADNTVLILGDNIFMGHDLPRMIKKAVKDNTGATIFGYAVKDPQRFGIVEFDGNEKVLSLEEKPAKPKSDYAAIGLYVFDRRASAYAKALTPSARGEIEITDLCRAYLKEGQLSLVRFGRGIFWVDAGTTASLFEAGNLVRSIEEVNKGKIGCIEEVAYLMGYINLDQLLLHVEKMKRTEYGEYLMQISRLKEEERKHVYVQEP
jgi:glucose-1-phosphate thymidylyltransferase